MNQSRMNLNTPLGELCFSVYSEDSSLPPEYSTIRLCWPKVKLPPGMAVDDLTVCILSCSPNKPISNLIFECAWASLPPRGGPESGQCLDAQSWENSSNIVMVGTEDYEAMSRRLSHINLNESDYPVKYMENGFQIKIPLIKAGQKISLHYAIASNKLPESIENSCWFAVDVNHEAVLKSRVSRGQKLWRLFFKKIGIKLF